MYSIKTSLLLLFAIALEISWALGLKFTAGFTLVIPSLLVILFLVLSVYTLSLVIKEIPVGTAYAVWTGGGTLGITILGIVFFNEAIELIRILAISMIVMGIVGLKYFTTSKDS